MTSFPASTRTYVNGANHRSVRVPFREIALHDNSSFRVYDTQGPWGDPEIECDVRMGLSPLREAWTGVLAILSRTSMPAVRRPNW